jgi:GNAT superfamily N-acetyltransferase
VARLQITPGACPLALDTLLARGRGAARAVLGGAARWAAARGINSLYLQVERDNTAALRVYGGAGFTELCGYHYRVAS